MCSNIASDKEFPIMVAHIGHEFRSEITLDTIFFVSKDVAHFKVLNCLITIDNLFFHFGYYEYFAKNIS